MKYIKLMLLSLFMLSMDASAQAYHLQHATNQAAVTAAQTALAADPENVTLQQQLARKEFERDKFADQVQRALGDNWLTILQNSQLANPNDEIADAYMAAPFALQSFDANGKFGSMASRFYFYGNVLSQAKKQELLNHLATKPTYVASDLQPISILPYDARIAARMPELAALLPSGAIRGVDYYIFRNMHVLKRVGKTFPDTMKTGEWIDMALQPSPIPPDVFIKGREFLMMRIAKLVMDARAAANQSTSGPEFEAALQPVLDALNAPKFGGLRAATLAVGVDLGIPDPLDTSAAETVAVAVQDAADRKAKFTTPWGIELPYEQGLGSVMLVLGKDGYETWRQQVLAND